MSLRIVRYISKIARENADKIITTRKPVGRWNINISEKEKLERAHWASSDHCGDEICGNPEKTKLLISIDKHKNTFKI